VLDGPVGIVCGSRRKITTQKLWEKTDALLQPVGEADLVLARLPL